MSKVKTITVTSTEQEIMLDATYQFVWFRNLGDNDCYVSDHSGIVAGADDVALCKAGECVRITLPQAPMSNKAYIKAVDGSNTVEVHAQNFSDKPTAKTGKGSGGGQSITVEPLSVTANGTYTAPTGKAYSPVSVDVQEQPWEPLQDGYSNFWFELTDDTLSPWLNFSAKNANAVIDWGDGSGEVALDTLTPTHTYSKAGKYVVKVKGVTGIATQHAQPYNGEYFSAIKNVELNSDVNALSSNAFRYCIGMEHFSSHSISLGQSTFYQCVNLKSADIVSERPNSIPISCFGNCHSLGEYEVLDNIATIDINAFNACLSLAKVQIPSTVTAIGNAAFRYSPCLSEIYIEATVPPTLGTNVFDNIASNYIIYVPVGYGDTYKAASGWSAYADHIVEEGSQLTRAQLRNIELENTKKGSDDEWQR